MCGGPLCVRIAKVYPSHSGTEPPPHPPQAFLQGGVILHKPLERHPLAPRSYFPNSFGKFLGLGFLWLLNRTHEPLSFRAQFMPKLAVFRCVLMVSLGGDTQALPAYIAVCLRVFACALGRSRTCGQKIRSLLLYPLSYEGSGQKPRIY